MYHVRECNVMIAANTKLAGRHIIQTYDIKFCKPLGMEHGVTGNEINTSSL
jgi:hypothetical protein